MKHLRNLVLFGLSLVLLGTSGCSRDAQVASRNLSEAADNFQINRRIVFINGITDKYLLSIEGRCSLDLDRPQVVAVTCKTSDTDYKKHYLGLSNNVTYMAEQLEPAAVSVYRYKVVFKPEAIIPDIRLKME
jgi:hypothetical protein